MTTTDLRVGDSVTVSANRVEYQTGGYGSRKTLYADQPYRVTRLYSDSAIIRNDEEHWSVQVNRSFLLPTEVDGKPRRKLGEHPEGEEGVDYILPTDPRLAWLWDDAATYANRSSWCGTYDEICSALGLPGRPRLFNVSKNINGITVTSSIQARSQQEANEKFAAALKPEAPASTTVD